MEPDPRRRSVKVVRILCDGCERASAVSYCADCDECACKSCADQLHVRGRRQSKRAGARTCNGRALKDLQKTVGVLALCVVCRTRPAHKYSSGEGFSLCQECRHAYSKPTAAPAQEIVKRAIADELRRASGKPASQPAAANSASAASRRRQKHHAIHKNRRDRKAPEDDSTADDITDSAFSRDSSAE